MLSQNANSFNFFFLRVCIYKVNFANLTIYKILPSQFCKFILHSLCLLIQDKICYSKVVAVSLQ